MVICQWTNIQQISRYLQSSVLPSLRIKSGQFLLTELVKRGDNHKIMNKWYQKFFMYLDRYYVKYHSLPTLEDAGLRHFKQLVFEEVKDNTTAAILDLIIKEREGTDVDRALIRSGPSPSASFLLLLCLSFEIYTCVIYGIVNAFSFLRRWVWVLSMYTSMTSRILC